MAAWEDHELDALLDWDEWEAPVSPERLPGLVQELTAVAPHIRWRVRSSEAKPVVAFPREQRREACFLLNRQQHGEDLTGYCPEWIYPALYAPVEGRWALRPAIATFVDLADRFGDLVRRSRQMPIRERIEQFATMLPKLYDAGQKLPQLSDAGCQPAANTAQAPPAPSLDFGHYDSYFQVKNKLKSPDDVNAHSLASDMLTIFLHVEAGRTRYQAGRPEQVEQAVAYWRRTYDEAWCDAAARAIAVLHWGLYNG